MIYFRIHNHALVLIAFLLVNSEYSLAQNIQPLLPEGENLTIGVGFHGHFGAAFGAVFSEDTRYSGHGAISGIPVNVDGKISFRPAAVEVLVADYALGEYAALEFQAGHSNVSTDLFEGNLGIADPPIHVKTNISGSVDDISGLFNLAIIPFGRDKALVPYFGGGIGFSSSWARLDSINEFGHAIPINLSSSQTNLSADIFAALEARVFTNFFAGLAYQFIWTEAGNIGSNQEFAAQNGSLKQHFLGLIAEYQF